MEKTTHYVYFWSHKDYGILYVGQGTQGKHPAHSQKYSRAYAKHKNSSIAGFLKNKNIKQDITILSDNLTKEEADLKETYLINFFGRKFDKSGCLLNVADGGRTSKPVKLMKKIVVNGIEFESIAACARYYGVSHGKICHCLRDGREIVSEHRGKRQIEYNGTTYNSLVELSKHFNLTEASVSYRLEKNIPLESQLRGIKIEYNGVVYESLKQLSEMFGLTTENTIRRLEKNIPLELPVIKRIKVKINGIIYNSISKAVKETGLTEKYIRYWVNRGKFKI